jgi:hypothetical protein
MCSRSDYIRPRFVLELRREYECFINDLIKDNILSNLEEFFLFLILIFSLFVINGFIYYQKYNESLIFIEGFIKNSVQSA